MFEPSQTPRVFGLPPGADFPRALVDGLLTLSRGQPPQALARVQVIVNTRRMARRIRNLFDQGPALLLPRVQMVTDLGESANLADIPLAVSALRRRLELVQLISSLLERQPDLAPRAALYDLADSLAALMDEMQGEGVPPEAIKALDISDQSGHWDRAKTFLTIVQQYFGKSSEPPDAEARQRQVVLRLIDHWATTPPAHPVIVAGSTGSRGTTHLLMQVVARLPQGAVVLPGFDFDMPARVWSALDPEMPSEDHPQYRFRKLMTALDLEPSDIRRWSETPPPNPARNRVVSLALRPAPVTDQWLTEGPDLTDIDSAMADVTLVEAPTPRQEALTIAMRLRQAAEDGQTAALITPDRMLTRQVTAALDQWGILPDDSAGLPLHQSPTGRYLRHVSALFYQRLTTEALLTLLKHPLTHTGDSRGPHLLLTHELELHLRHIGLPFPDAVSLTDWAAKQTAPMATDWAAWICRCFLDKVSTAAAPLTARLDIHIALAEDIAQGYGANTLGVMWQRKDGREAQSAVAALLRDAPFAGDISAADYYDLFGAVLSREEVREHETPHPDILIWGTLEARVQGADLLILAGLNDGTWPESPKPDPWLNRKMRHDAGLLLPERRIGLSAHDFQQAIGAREVWLTRALRSDDAETVVSRWLNRLSNLLNGLPNHGTNALNDMRARGQIWLARARLLEEPEFVAAAPRPSPRPPVDSRPSQLSVTEIKRLIRDPYAIYGRHVLRLKPLNPLMRAPDALLRGIVIHEILEAFVLSANQNPTLRTREHLLAIAQPVLDRQVPWADTRLIWLARIGRFADWFLASEEQRLSLATPLASEVRGRADMADLGFTLTATADRIDRDGAGRLHIYDYKTGTLPSAAVQREYDKQLLLEAVIAEKGGFQGIGAAEVARAVFIGLGSAQREVAAPLEETPPALVWEEFHSLIRDYSRTIQGYSARRAMFSKDDISDYDQLSRFGEWDITQRPNPQEVT